MKTISMLLLATLLSACGGAPCGSGASDTSTGTGSGGGSGGGSGRGGAGPATHVYEMDVTCQGTDFQYAPAIFGVGANQLSPGPQSCVSGQTLTYTLTDTQADLQITGNGDHENNPGFYVSVVILKDGVQVLSWNVGTGVSQDSGTL